MINKLIANIEKGFTGKREIIEKVIAAMLAGGHILIDDVPGVGKTTLAKSLSASINCGFTRIQFTPDTLPSDVVGMTIYNMATGKFETVQGAIMNNIIMADEINRTSPKTQASLLEAMEEKQVTIDGTKYELPELFMVIATENPVEYAGTYVLPEAELDRFMIRLSLGYPDKETEIKLIMDNLDGMAADDIQAVLNENDVISMKQQVSKVTLKPSIIEYITNIVRETRESEDIILGASPRAAIALAKMSQAMAFINERDYVIPDDVLYIVTDVLAHRMIYAPLIAAGKDAEIGYVKQLIKKIPVPNGMNGRG